MGPTGNMTGPPCRALAPWEVGWAKEEVSGITSRSKGCIWGQDWEGLKGWSKNQCSFQHSSAC